MKTNVRYLLAAFSFLALAFTFLEGKGLANMIVGGSRAAVGGATVNCYFGAFRKDGQIMVNMVPGAAGALYRLWPSVRVTLNGRLVGTQYLVNGMPIVLILDGNQGVAEIRVR